MTITMVQGASIELFHDLSGDLDTHYIATGGNNYNKKYIGDLVNVQVNGQSGQFRYDPLTDSFEVLDAEQIKHGTVEVTSSDLDLVSVVGDDDNTRLVLDPTNEAEASSDVNIVFTLKQGNQTIGSVEIPVTFISSQPSQ
ncbi:hypothetical protein [Sporosarcina sp. FSL K6-5500]|uniref:hypothetical protein n=1 Tax=Sporosarcina sp. FSL K6-5500 TaxID=2921558 RepID=UPI0030F6FDD8